MCYVRLFVHWGHSRARACLPALLYGRGRGGRGNRRARQAQTTRYAHAQTQTTRCPLHCTHLCRARSVFGQVSQGR